VVPDTPNPAIVRDHAAAIAIDQAANELLGGFFHEHFVPRLEPDRPQVLPAWSVLRQKAWPVLRIVLYDDASSRLPCDRCVLPRHQSVDGFATPTDYSGVFLVERDPQMPYAQVQAEQIAIRVRRKAGEVMDVAG
jgi:hypothetical protein